MTPSDPTSRSASTPTRAGPARRPCRSSVRSRSADLGVEFVEQPVVADDVEGMAWVRARVGLPIMADESCYGLHDLERIIRLGRRRPRQRQARQVRLAHRGRDLLRRAEEAGLGTIVGSMMESHVGSAPPPRSSRPSRRRRRQTSTPRGGRSRRLSSAGSPTRPSEIRMPSGSGFGITGWVDGGVRAVLRVHPSEGAGRWPAPYEARGVSCRRRGARRRPRRAGDPGRWRPRPAATRRTPSCRRRASPR